MNPNVRPPLRPGRPIRNFTTGLVRLCNETILDPDTGLLQCNTTRRPRPHRPPTGPPPLPCYTCTTACIVKSVELAFIIGVLANILVITRVIIDKQLRKPTFIAIACLALSDAIFVLAELVVACEVVIKNLTECPKTPSVIQGGYYAIVTGTTWFAANGHLTLLAVVRFVMIVFPLKAHVYLTTKKVIISSVCIWIVSFVVFLGRFIDNKVRGKKEADTTERLLVLWIIAYLIPGLCTCILHLVKLRLVRKASRNEETAEISKQGQRMTTIILLIIFSAFVFPIPKFIYDILQERKHKFKSNQFSVEFKNIGILMFHLNNTLNPFIYALFSEPFRRSIQNMFRCSNKQQSKDQANYKSMDTSTYSLASMDSPSLQKRSESEKRRYLEAIGETDAKTISDSNDNNSTDEAASDSSEKDASNCNGTNSVDRY